MLAIIQDQFITLFLLPGCIVKDQLEAIIAQLIDQGLLLDEALFEIEKKYILKVLDKNKGNQTRAAKILGIHRNTLTKKLVSYNHHKGR